MSLAVLLVVFLTLLRSSWATVQAQSAAGAKPAVQEDALASFERELADIRLALRAERAYAAAEPRLATLKTALAARTEPGARTLEAEVDRLAAEVARALGKVVAPDPVDEAVLAALERGDYVFVKQLGARAAAGLAEAVRRNPDELPGSIEDDPLRILASTAPLPFSALASELAEQDGFFWKRRLMRAVLARDFGSREELWTTDTPQVWLGTGLQAALERLADDPDVGQQALQALAGIVTRGVASPRFEATLYTALHSADSSQRNSAKGVARGARRVLRSLLERLLRDDDPDLRGFAAERLVDTFPFDRTWLDRANDPELTVRASLSEGLSKTNPAGWTEIEHAALAAFSADPDAEVREDSWRVLTSASSSVRKIELPAAEGFDGKPVEVQRVERALPVPPELLRSLVRSPERKILADLAPGYPAPLCYELLGALAGDSDPTVAKEVAKGLRECAVFEDPAAALAVASKLGDNAVLAREDWLYMAKNLADQLTRMRSGLRTLMSWLLEGEEEELLQKLLEDSGTLPHLAAVDRTLFRGAFVRAYRMDRDRTSATRLDITRSALADSTCMYVKDEFVLLTGDSSHPMGLRVLALRGALTGGLPAEEARGLALSLPGSSGWEDVAASDIEQVLHRLPPAVANELVVGMLRDRSVSPRLASAAVLRFDPSAPGAAEVVRLVLDRGEAAPEPWNESLRHVLGAMGQVPALQDPDVITRAARDPELARSAFRAIRLLRDSRYLPLLSAIVAEPTYDLELRWATEALFGYLDAEAVEPLLAAAGKAPDAETRDACLAHLERIREYQDARERWATRRAKAQTREQVIAELVELLDAPLEGARVHAIKALATWEAVEQMPRLIALTSDPSAAVSLAAKQALEKLNDSQRDE